MKMQETSAWRIAPLDSDWGRDPQDPSVYRASYYKRALETEKLSRTLRRRDTLPLSDERDNKLVTSQEVEDGKTENVVELPRWKHLPGIGGDTFAAFQEWEGYITEVRGDKFVAALIDITKNSKSIDGVAEIPIVEASESDQDKIVVGAIFRLVIGVRKRGSQRFNMSHIYFRRISRLATRQIDNISLVFEDD